MKKCLASLMLACFIANQSAAAPREPVRLIFDTDMMGDVDDVGATALLHALADRGEVEILGMGLSGKNPWSPACLDALNTYFGRPDLPIGIVKGDAFEKRSRYAEQIAEEFPQDLPPAEQLPDAALVYRKILADQPDGSVVMVSIGQLTNFHHLLLTEADEYSPLDGVELVRKKVKAWVCMGGKFPSGREANTSRDPAGSAGAIDGWPTPIIFSGWSIGQEIMTGEELKALPESSPVRRAYVLYNDLSDRQSWDQTAVLYAVRGLDGGMADYWDLHRGGACRVDEKGDNRWDTTVQSDQAYLVKKMPPERIAEQIEQLMLHQPGQ